MVPWLCGVLHTLKNRVARVFIPGSLLAVGSNKRNRNTFLAVLSGARSTTRADERCTEVTIQNDRYWISEHEGSIRNRFQLALATRQELHFLLDWPERSSEAAAPRTTVA